MAIKTLRVFAEFTSTGFVPMPTAAGIDYGFTVANTYPASQPSTFQTDNPDLVVTVTAMTDFYVWIRLSGTAWNPSYTRNVRVYPDSPNINNVVMNMIIATGPAGTSAYSQIVQTSNRLYFNGATTDSVYNSKFAGKTYINELNFGTAPQLATVATSGAYADLTGKPALSTVATSGSYADLSNKPSGTAPISYNSGTNSFQITQASTSTNGFLSSTDWNTFNAKYLLPSGGTTAQYLRGDGTLATFPTTLDSTRLIFSGRNNTGTTLTKGTVVYINGVSGNTALLARAIASADSTSAQTLGVVEFDIANNATGVVVLVGAVNNLDTSSFTEGVQLYLSGTVAGAFTSSKVLAPTHIVYVGIVTRAHPTLGTIEVKIQNGYELDEIHDVQISSPANKDILYHDTASSLWKHASIASVLGYTPYNATNPNNYIALTALSASAPLSYNNTTGAFTISQANTTTNGFLSSTDWNTFNSKQNALTLGNVSEVASNVLMFPDGGTGKTIGNLTIQVKQSSASQPGFLSSADWTTFNSKQNALTNPVTGTGTTNTLPKWTSSSALGNSNITDSGSLITLGSNTTISSGSLGIGTTSIGNYSLNLAKTITGGGTAGSVINQGAIQSGVTTVAFYNVTVASTQEATFTLPVLSHYEAQQATFGAGSTVTTQVGFRAHTSLIGGVTNIGFQGQIPAGTNRWNLYMDGTADNYLAGSLGIGQTSLTGFVIRVNKAITGATTSVGMQIGSVINSDVTANGYGFRTILNTQASTFTLPNLTHYFASQGVIGAGSSVITQVGFRAEFTLTGATNNYGFFGEIPSGTGRWNLFMSGTANNYLAGNLGIGITTPVGEGSDDILTHIHNPATTGAARAMIRLTNGYTGSSWGNGSFITVDSSQGLYIGNSEAAPMLLFTSGSERMRITSDGKLQVGGNPSIGGINEPGKISLFQNDSKVYSSSGNFDSDLFVVRVNGSIVSNQTASLQLVASGNNGTNAGRAIISVVQTNQGLSTGDIVFQNNNNGTIAERMRITSGGNLGVGTTSPSARLEVRGNSTDGWIRLSTTSGNPFITSTNEIGFQTGSGNNNLYLFGSGNVGINNTVDTGYRLYVSGNIYATSNITANSDLTLKKNLTLVDNPIDKLNQLNGYLYQWKENDEYQYGVIAQEVEKILPHAVLTGNNGIKGVAYNQIIPILIEAVKELNKKLEAK